MPEEPRPDVRSISVQFVENGDLVVEVVDSGPLVEKFFGDSDYEFWYRVSADRLEPLAIRLGCDLEHLLEEIRAHWLGERFYELEVILKEPGIAAKFTSY